MDIKELIGITLGTCTLERVIGRGGMGAVFLAQQSRPVRTVAIKVLLPAENYDPDDQRIFLERFSREANTIAKLDHRNILQIYEYDEALVNQQRLAYLVMPFIRGGTLRERIDEMKRDGARFDLKLVTSYIDQVADALDYAHSKGVVHRDIKPGNLLFHQDGRLLLSDFGIVHLNTLPSLTMAGSFLGTAEYASPEQVSTGQVNAPSDIYSLGVILYELLTGNVPFTGPNAFAVMTKVLSDPVPPMRTARPDLSPAIEAVVMKSLAKRPDDRYQQASDMATALRAAISMPASALRITGDANNSDLTVATGFQPSPPLAPGAVPVARDTVRALPPTDPAVPLAPQNQPVAPWQQGPRGWQWPSQQAQMQAPVVVATQQAGRQGVPPTPAGGYTPLPRNPLPTPSSTQAEDADNAVGTSFSASAPTSYRQGRRLYYYSVALLALLLQIPTFILLFATASGNLASPAVLGVLTGTGINLLALAATAFTAVTRSRNTSKFLYRCLAITLLAPILSGIFINFGTQTAHSTLGSLAAYLLLLLSNLFAIRQLALVDTAGDQVEVTPILWRPLIAGALTGLLPLTIILIFSLLISSSASSASPLLLGLFVSLFFIIIGAPTPGAMMAIALSKKMSFAALLRSSALAGMLMFLGAFLLTVLWSFIPPKNPLFFYHFGQPWIVVAFLVFAVLLGLIGALRGMLDAWVYQRVTRAKP